MPEESAAGPETSRKRPRTEVDASISSDLECAQASQDAEFWIADGTVILLAGNVMFRVYQGVLAEHSPVFAEMLSLPQPANVSVPCPVIKLYDNPEDWRHMLRLLVPRKGSKYASSQPNYLVDVLTVLGRFTPHHEPTFDMLSAYIRLAHKYQMDDILEQWMVYLKRHFTSSFYRWVSHDRLVPGRLTNIHAIGVVNLARLTGHTSILPTALAVCTTLDEKIIDGFAREDGTREQLSADDLGRCFKLQKALIQANAAAVLKALSSKPSPIECRHSNVCESQLEEILETHHKQSFASFLAPEGLVPKWKPYNEQQEEYGICGVCRDMIDDVYHTEQWEIWRRLPLELGLEVDGWGKSR